MKQVVLKYGVFAALIILGLSFLSFAVNGGTIDIEGGEVVGYTTMALAFTMVYLGIRSYRMSTEDKKITFGLGFAIGGLISLFATVAWVGGWEIMTSIADIDFMKEYTEYMVANMQEEGKTAAEIAIAREEMESYAEMAKNPFVRFLFGAGEILPIGILVSARECVDREQTLCVIYSPAAYRM